MAEIVNLRTARKRAARDRKAAEAEQNRARHGETAAERSARRLAAERAENLAEGHRRDRTDTAE